MTLWSGAYAGFYGAFFLIGPRAVAQLKKEQIFHQKFAGPLAHGRVRSLKTFLLFHFPFPPFPLASFLLSLFCFLVARVADSGTPAGKSRSSPNPLGQETAPWAHLAPIFLFLGDPGAISKIIDFSPSPKTSQMAQAIDPGRPQGAFWTNFDDFWDRFCDRFSDFFENGDNHF